MNEEPIIIESKHDIANKIHLIDMWRYMFSIHSGLITFSLFSLPILEFVIFLFRSSYGLPGFVGWLFRIVYLIMPLYLVLIHFVLFIATNLFYKRMNQKVIKCIISDSDFGISNVTLFNFSDERCKVYETRRLLFLSLAPIIKCEYKPEDLQLIRDFAKEKSKYVNCDDIKLSKIIKEML